MAGQWLYTTEDWARHQLIAMGKGHYKLMVEKVLEGEINVPSDYWDAMLSVYNEVMEVESVK